MMSQRTSTHRSGLDTESISKPHVTVYDVHARRRTTATRPRPVRQIVSTLNRLHRMDVTGTAKMWSERGRI